MNFLPQTTIQPVSGSQAAKAAAEPMTRRDLADLTQSSDAPWPVARHRLHRSHARRRETRVWWHVTEEAKLACDESSEAGTAE